MVNGSPMKVEGYQFGVGSTCMPYFLTFSTSPQIDFLHVNKSGSLYVFSNDLDLVTEYRNGTDDAFKFKVIAQEPSGKMASVDFEV